MLIGTMLLSAINRLIDNGLSNKTSPIRNLGFILGLFVGFACYFQRTCALDETTWAHILVRRAEDYDVPIRGLNDTKRSVSQFQSRHDGYNEYASSLLHEESPWPDEEEDDSIDGEEDHFPNDEAYESPAENRHESPHDQEKGNSGGNATTETRPDCVVAHEKDSSRSVPRSWMSWHLGLEVSVIFSIRYHSY